jgi:hypothetical protein
MTGKFRTILHLTFLLLYTYSPLVVLQSGLIETLSQFNVMRRQKRLGTVPLLSDPSCTGRGQCVLWAAQAEWQGHC